MQNPFIGDLEELVNAQAKKLGSGERSHRVGTVALFDLAKSTKTKRDDGHRKGVRDIRLHNSLCRELVKEFDGQVIKELGDGVLVVFEEPMKACLASANLLMATRMHTSFSTKGALANGEFEELEIDGRADILGDTIDECSRILDFADDGEIVFASKIKESVTTFVRDYRYFSIASTGTKCVPDFGMRDLYKIVPSVPTLFLRETGRRNIDEKVEFVADASHEIIEIGIGLTTFTEYFESRRRSQFEQKIRDLLNRNVDIKCVMIDPDSRAAELYTDSMSDPDYLDEIRESESSLIDLKESFKDEDMSGNFDIYQHDHIPLFHGVCVDLSHSQGKMYTSNYLYGIERRNAPGLGFSSYSNPDLFARYRDSVEHLIETSNAL